jgi:Zn finger protein HypA/HybF involved in hydrogenase expression
MTTLACPKCGETMEIVPPKRVWISWCPTCGEPDYSYRERPLEAAAGDCPHCGTPQKIVGPYNLEVTP